MNSAAQQPAAASSEDDEQRHDRQLVELLNELRVALPGVQMLFGFLLAVPFSQRFTSISDGQRTMYYATFVAAAAASACLIAPTSFHRIVWRHHLKRRLVHFSSGLAIAGTAFLAAAITGSVALVTSLLFGSAPAVLAGSLVAGALIALWYVAPLVYRVAGGGEPDR